MTKEPVAYIAGIVALIELIIPVALVFGWINWSTEQVGMVMALVIGVGTIAGGWIARSKVSPVE